MFMVAKEKTWGIDQVRGYFTGERVTPGRGDLCPMNYARFRIVPLNDQSLRLK